MKKLLILLSIISIFSCKNDDDTGSGTAQYFSKIDINTEQFLTDISFMENSSDSFYAKNRNFGDYYLSLENIIEKK